MTQSDKLDLGAVQGHKKVFAEIIAAAISEVKWASLLDKNIGNRLFELLGKKEFPGINVKVDDQQNVTLELQVLVQYGMNIPDVARQIQEAVKSAVDKALDVNLKDINVNVQG